MILDLNDFFEKDDFSIFFYNIDEKYKDQQCFCYIREIIRRTKSKNLYPIGSNFRIFLIHSACVAHQLYNKWHKKILENKGLLL